MSLNPFTTIHVYPVNDLKSHDTESENCWCKPRIEYENGVDIIIHNSADGRELFETKTVGLA